MKKFIGKKRIIILAVVLFLLFSSTGAFYLIQAKNTQPPPISAILEIFTQPVWVEINGTKHAANSEETITVGEKIVTGAIGRAQLLYPDHSVTRIDSNSEFTLAKLTNSPQQVEVDINKGRIWSRVAKLSGQEQYQSKTSTVVATVRGTSYGHEILANGQNKIITAKHYVLVTCRNNTQKGTVASGKQFFLNCQHGSFSTITSLDQTDLNDPWYLFNLYQDEVLDKRFGANTYQDENGNVQPSVTLSSTPTDKFVPTYALLKPTFTPTPKPTSAQTQTNSNQQPTATNVPPANTPTPTLQESAPSTPTPTSTLLRRPPILLLPTSTPTPPLIQ